MSLRLVSIEEAWPVLGPLAAALLTDPAEASAEDLRQACLREEAACLEAINGDGFIVTRVQVNPVTSESELIVWLAISTTDDQGMFERYLPDVEKIARDLNYASVVFYSQRAGWLRKATRCGFAVRNICMAKRLETLQ